MENIKARLKATTPRSSGKKLCRYFVIARNVKKSRRLLHLLFGGVLEHDNGNPKHKPVCTRTCCCRMIFLYIVLFLFSEMENIIARLKTTTPRSSGKICGGTSLLLGISKRPTPGIPTWSPTVLTWPDDG
jgi:hypothetical protein